MAFQLKRAYVGMQCFWGAESSFAKIGGVLKTRVGYAGGTTSSPNYARIGDHTEITEVQYDPTRCSYAELLDWFFDHHDPAKKLEKQYQSAILWVDDTQREVAEKAMQKAREKHGGQIDTYLKKFDKFYQAEDYHQKYWLRTQHKLFCSELKLTDAEVVDSTLAAKLNAFLDGYTDFAYLYQLQKENNLSDSVVKLVEEISRAGGVPACH